ncbi:MAG: hypothetical protein JW709_08265 [Sedimentisphaerales bacterium]|nr:hypothetical protein [Sedimentisphaerales bacterium]
MESRQDSQDRRQWEIEQARRDLEQACLEISQAQAAESSRKMVFQIPQPPPAAPPKPASPPKSDDDVHSPVQDDFPANSREETLNARDRLLSDEELEALLDESATYDEFDEEISDCTVSARDTSDEMIPKREEFVKTNRFNQEQRLSLAEQIRLAAKEEQHQKQVAASDQESTKKDQKPEVKPEITQISKKLIPVSTSGTYNAGHTALTGAQVLRQSSQKGRRDRDDDIMEAIVLADITAFRHGR